jgi:hypothetical protein
MLNNFTVLISIYKNNTIVDIVNLVKSIKSQNLYPAQIIFIYDGVIKEEINTIIKTLKNLKIITNHKNIGLGDSLKKGVTASKYNLIIRCDADDVNVGSRFRELIKIHINNTSYDVIGSIQEEIFNNKKIYKNLPLDDEKIKKKLIYRNCINHPTVLIKKKTVLRAGNYENVGKYLSCNNFEDYYLWLKMKKINARFINIPKILIKSKIKKTFYERRVGKDITINYKMFLKKCYKNKLLNRYNIFINYFLRILVYKMPTKYFINFVNIFLRFKFINFIFYNFKVWL